MKKTTLTSISIESQISEVMVYLSGAQVTRTARLPLTAGVQSFVFAGLPAELESESIQVSTEDGVAIRSVEYAINHLQPEDQTEEITALRKKLKDLESHLLREKNKIELGALEETLFAKNMEIAGQESGLKAEDLKSTVLFYNERMSVIRDVRMTCQEQIEDLNTQIDAVRSQLGSFDQKKPEPVSDVTVTVSLDEESDDTVSEKTLALSYFVNKASWKPFYDIRVKDVSSDISLYYKGRISQNSGETWENVKLSLSTGNPSLNGTCPELHPWHLDFQKELLVKPSLSRRRYSSAAHVEEGLFTEDEAIALMYTGELPAIPEGPESAVKTTDSITSVEYTITAPYTLASGDEGQDVKIVEHSLPAKYRYYSIRKLEREVFLLAAVSGWEHLNLVAGEATVFFENRYVGKTHIDPLRADETMDLSLGPDKSVIVTRIRGKDFTAKTLTGGNMKQTRQWELTVRNLKPFPIEIELKDQVPISANKQITVNVIEISEADMVQDTGILTWKFTLEPAESKSMTVKYTVTSPQGIPVVLE
ncbi:MAG: DUF4139 domain-containing protein [Peptococcaceae bacterium]|nr:DUF4139 domain-containing protein [Peptococcaceae bacterium]